MSKGTMRRHVVFGAAKRDKRSDPLLDGLMKVLLERNFDPLSRAQDLLPAFDELSVLRGVAHGKRLALLIESAQIEHRRSRIVDESLFERTPVSEIPASLHQVLTDRDQDEREPHRPRSRKRCLSLCEPRPDDDGSHAGSRGADNPPGERKRERDVTFAKHTPR